MRIALPVLALSILVPSVPASAATSCEKYETLRQLPKAFKVIGEGHLPRRKDEPGTPGLDNLVVLSDRRCECHNGPILERDRGRPVPDQQFWNCSSAHKGRS